jgi:uncharacterized membrane protein YjgN (DUF898 family)
MSGRLQSNLTFGAIFGHLLLWLLITIVTLGIGGLFWPYATANFVLRSLTVVVDGRALQVKPGLGLGGQFLHMLGWGILIVITAGLAYPFYFFKVVNVAINSAE